MKYKVEWTPAAERDLAELWMDAADRQRLTAAANALDVALRENAHLVGESRGGSERVTFAPPLGCWFDVDQSRGVVLVRSVYRMRRRR